MVKVSEMNRWHRIELLGAVSLVIVLIGVFFVNQMDFSNFFRSSNLVTGFVSSEVLTENVDIAVSESQEFLMQTDNEFRLTSLRLTGKVEGEGLVQIFFEDDMGGQSLVYTNLKKKGAGNLVTGKANNQGSGNLITGKAVAAVENGEVQITIDLEPGEKRSVLEKSVPEGYELAGDSFYNVCVDTCFLSAYFSPETSNKLIFQMSEGVTLRISRLSYTTE